MIHDQVVRPLKIQRCVYSEYEFILTTILDQHFYSFRFTFLFAT